ncbi:MAG: ABC transporter permease [Anaerovoracaceae bacterium]
MKTRLLKTPIYVTAVLLIVVPFIYLVILSFMTRGETWGFELEFTLDNYKGLLDPLYIDVFVDSFKLAIISTVAIAIIGYPFGYFMAKLRSKWKARLMILLMIPFWISGLLRLYGWIIMFRSNGVLDKMLMKLSIIDEPLKLLYTYPAVVVGMVYALLPFMIFAVYQSAEKMDWNLPLAARDLGASRFKAFTSVTLPMTMPGLLSGVILSFIPSMGLFFIADILGGNKVVLVGNIISDLMTTGRNMPMAAAMSVVLLILTSLSLWIYKRVTKTTDLEGLF